LQQRYSILVQQHAHSAGKLSAGPSAPPDANSAFAATQAAWRFFTNERVTLLRLVEPLQQVASQWRQTAPTTWALAIHDWSVLSYPGHRRKTDRKLLGAEHGHGYDLSSVLLVDGADGSPVAPLELSLQTAQAVYSTRTPPPALHASRLDEVALTMAAVGQQGLGPQVVHVIDREADSLAHYRDWQTAGHVFLVRADDNRKVLWQKQELSLAEINQRLQAQGQFQRSREVSYRGHKAVQHVAETAVTLHRPAWRHRRNGDEVCNRRVPGDPIELRLIIARVCNEQGQTVAVWYLLSNVPAEVGAETVALWYYWRWRIESFFKLLKSAGQDAENWLQESGEAIAKRLLVAAMACVVVWKLDRATSAEALSFRAFLIRLSGRQMKYGKDATAPALLAGLWVYLSMLEALEHHTVEELRAMEQHLRFTKPDTG
jgi:hypothetical protein